MNKPIPSDPTRRIKLEGVGEVARPVDIDQSVTGFSELVSLRIYKFLQDQVINGEAEDDEVCIVLLSGEVTMEVSGKENHSWKIGGRKTLESSPHVIYLPPYYHYRLSVHSDAEVAYARARAEGRFPPRLIRPDDIETATIGQGISEHRVAHIFQEGDAEKLLCREVRTPAGHWQTAATDHYEQLAYCRMTSNSTSSNPNAFALARLYDADNEEAVLLKDSDSLAIRHCHYTIAVPPDCTLYSLCFLVSTNNQA